MSNENTTKPAKKYDSFRVYTPPLFTRFVKAKAEVYGQSESSIVADAVKKMWEQTPIQERERIMNHYK